MRGHATKNTPAVDMTLDGRPAPWFAARVESTWSTKQAPIALASAAPSVEGRWWPHKLRYDYGLASV